MEVTHPFANATKALVLDPLVLAYVARIKELPQIDCDVYVKAYWKAIGVVPAGRYSDPSTAQAERAVEGLYHALKGAKITRHRVAVALNFQSADQVDAIRDRLMARNAQITSGRPGISVNSTKPVKDVIAAQAAKREVEVA